MVRDAKNPPEQARGVHRIESTKRGVSVGIRVKKKIEKPPS